MPPNKQYSNSGAKFSVKVDQIGKESAPSVFTLKEPWIDALRKATRITEDLKKNVKKERF